MIKTSDSPPVRRGRDDRPVTIQDVAARAGVSISTVSRVVTGSVAVDPVTAGRVREAIDALAYRPNLLARSFRQRVTHTIGLLVPDNANPFFAEVARTIEDAGFAEGYSVVLCNSDLSPVKQETYIDVMLAKRVDGLILVSSGVVSTGEGHDAERRILANGAPVVVIDRDLGTLPIDQIMIDNVQGGYLAGSLLTRLGHRQVACIVGASDAVPGAGRFTGFRQALTEVGVSMEADRFVRGNGNYDGGAEAVRELLRREVPFTALFALNDLMAIGAIGELQRLGRRVPDDVSVIGFDDIPQGAWIYPSLTTVAQPIAEMGKLGVRLLLDRLANRDAPPERIVLPTRLVERESTGPAPGTA